MNRKKGAFKILILVLILAVPGFLYYLLTAEGKNRYKPLPIFGPKYLAKTSHTFHGKKIPDTVFHQVNDFNLMDEDGQPVSFKSIGSQILVVNFFYTHCTDCAQMMSSMDSLATYYGKNKRITFVSITVDPQRDSPEILKAYAAKVKPLGAKWLFLTGNAAVIDTLANKGLLVDALQNGDNSFVYSDKLILLDPERRIRGYYSAASVDDVNRLGDELKVQIAEELRKIKAPSM